MCTMIGGIKFFGDDVAEGTHELTKGVGNTSSWDSGIEREREIRGEGIWEAAERCALNESTPLCGKEVKYGRNVCERCMAHGPYITNDDPGCGNATKDDRRYFTTIQSLLPFPLLPIYASLLSVYASIGRQNERSQSRTIHVLLRWPIPWPNRKELN